MRQMPVRQNQARSRFELDADGGTAHALYRLDGGRLILLHTETPAHLRGRGIGSQLVRGVLEAARDMRLKVEPRCGFVRSYMAQHPEFNDLLA
jgi:predicted GNAT family acetyltransferase